MTSDYLKHSRSLDEVYDLIDKNRAEAAKVAQAKFHNEMEGAIATIASIGSIACARIQADSRVGSAKVLIEAEVAASRLLAEAELEASKWAAQIQTKPREVVDAALMEVGRNASLQLAETAKASVASIHQNAELAIKVLRETGAIAILEVQTLAAKVGEQTKRDAELAAEKLKEYRKSARTPEDAVSEGEDLAQILIKAAHEASAKLQETVKLALAKINTVTDEACLVIHEAALAAEKKLLDGRERALARLKDVLQAFHRPDARSD